jgi:hypothetical protein
MIRWHLWCGFTEFVLGKSLESGGRFCFGAFGKNLASVALNKYERLICIVNRFCRLCSPNAIYKDNAPIVCITVQNIKVHSL